MEQYLAPGLTPKQRRAVAALLQGANQTQAAEAAGVNRNTIGRWLESAAFRAELSAGQDAMMEEAARRIVAGVGDALDTLADTMADTTATPAARVAAARVILDAATRWIPPAAVGYVDIDVTVLSDSELEAIRDGYLKRRANSH